MAMMIGYRLNLLFMLVLVIHQLLSTMKCYLIHCLIILFCVLILVLMFTLIISLYHQHKVKKHGRLFYVFEYIRNLDFQVSRDEMKKFFAIIVHMGMIQKRSIYEYWSTDPYVKYKYLRDFI